jgi:hypothetical protein
MSPAHSLATQMTFDRIVEQPTERLPAATCGSRPGELEYDPALAAAKRLDAEVALVVAQPEGRPERDSPFARG